MRYIVLVVALLLAAPSCTMENPEPQPDVSPPKARKAAPKPRKAPTVYPRTQKTKTDAQEEYKKHLVEGILTMRGQFRHVTREFAERIVKEVFEVIAMPGNGWIKPHDLIGLAINESDLRTWVVTGTYVKPDCGITQNHTPLFAKSLKERRALCKRLTESTKLSFIYAMKEMNMIDKRYCSRYVVKPKRRKKESLKRFNARIQKWKMRRYRCLYNNFNQGPQFLWKSCEQRTKEKKYSPEKYKRRLRLCQIRDLYWVRSLCFSTGVKLNKKPSQSCRRAWSVKWIKRVYGIK